MTNHRSCLVFSGTHEWCQDSAKKLLDDSGFSSVLWVSNSPPDGVNTLRNEQAKKVLGQEFSAVVVDAWSGLNPDVLGAIAGTVHGGGVLVLLVPNLREWPQFNDPEYKRLTNTPYQITDIQGRFLQRLSRIISSDPDITLLTQETEQQFITGLPTALTLDEKKHKLKIRTTDQQKAIDAVIKVATGRRRRPVVLNADRGRGKSAALGMAAAELLQQGVQRIIVTAPRKEAVATLFEHAALLFPESATKLVFMPPDELCRSKPQTDLLLVDEAAAIPVPMLDKLLSQYARIVFSTTIHGYEGTGRGFCLRFHKILDQRTPGWKTVYLKQPVRFAENDPVERFIFRALMLDASYAPIERVDRASPSNSVVERINRDELVKDESLLSQLFGLLIFAHYRTRPNDLRHLLDAPNLSVYVLRHEGFIVATALVSQEGGLDDILSKAIYEGHRRVQGHLIPQSLAAHAGLVNAPELKCARIMRIAVHPELHGRGLGTQLLAEVTKMAKVEGVDYIGASFGATCELIRFWRSSDYHPVHLGLKREHVSGSHAVMVLKALTNKGEGLYQQARQKFFICFPHLLSESLCDLEPEIVSMLMFNQANNQVYIKEQINCDEWRDIKAFSFSKRGYEVTLLPLWKLTVYVLADSKYHNLLSDKQRSLLVTKILQKKKWPNVISLLNLKGRSQAIEMLRQIMADLYAAISSKQSSQKKTNR